MRFEYTPETALSSDRQCIKNLIRRIVAEYGRPRSAVGARDDRVTLSFDTPGGLRLAGDLLDLAAGGLDSMHYEAIQLMSPHGWLGDLEPGSPETSLFRMGPPRAIGVFMYDSSISASDNAPPLLAGIDWMVEIAERKEVTLVKLRGNSAFMLSLARQILWLSEPHRLKGKTLEYMAENVPGRRLPRLILERGAFSPTAPWAHVPEPSAHDSTG